MSRQASQIVLAGVLGAALLLRLIYLWQAVHTPLFEVLLIDSDFYDRQARRLAAGDWLGEEVFFMNPFYPYFLGLLYAAFGSSLWVAGLVQALMGTASCALVYWLGRRIWSEGVGLMAAGLAASYGVLIFYDGALLTATPIVFFNLLALALLLQWRLVGGRFWLLGAGVALGVSATARPLVLLFVGLLVLWLGFQKGWRRGLAAWGWLLLGAAMVLGSVAARNAWVGGEWVLTTAAGMNFYVGNHPGATGIYAQVEFLQSAEPERERAQFLREAQRRSGQLLKEGEASHFWLGEGLRFIREEPGAYVRLLGRKLYLFWNRVEAQNNLSYYLATDLVPLLGWCVLGWGVLAPVGLAAGLVLRPVPGQRLLDLYGLSYLLGCLVFFVSSEYRLAVVPVLLLHAARGMVWAGERMRQRAYARLAPLAGLALLLGLPINHADALAHRLMSRRLDYYNFGALYERQGKWARAEEMFRRSLEIDADFAPARQGLARLYQQQGRQGEALAAGLAQPVDPALQRAMALYGQGEYEQALEAFAQVLEREGERPELYNNVGLCQYKLRRFAQAEASLGRALALAPDYARAQYNLGMVFLAQEEFARAEAALARVLELEEGHAQARYKLGELYARLGRPKEAQAQWDRLLQSYPGDAALKARVDSLKRLEKGDG
jgi:Tfp pilus assembly protein PilF/4-amino-4-deoxy-L-arabinose transferase-like glycosyltransferase